MAREGYQKTRLGSESYAESVRRPAPITLICAIGLFFSLVAVPFVFSSAAKAVGAWYPFYTAVLIAISVACYIGIWQMRKVAAYIYAAFEVVRQLVLLTIGLWSSDSFFVNGFIVAVILYYSRRMR
jgi:hypothetical protein